jgi:hypothetical protein
MIKSYINQSEFIDALTRTYDDTNFTYDGKVALFEYLEQLSDDIGNDIELDTIALCCEYSEYTNAVEAAQACGYEEGVDLEEQSLDLIEVSEKEEAQALEWLEHRTQVISFDKGIIIQTF